MTPLVETCPCGARYEGDGFSAINFRKAHEPCREAWQATLDAAVSRHPAAHRQECSTCGGVGYVGGLVVSDDESAPTVDEVCRRCDGRGVLS